MPWEFDKKKGGATAICGGRWNSKKKSEIKEGGKIELG
jgi:hypothetical protein